MARINDRLLVQQCDDHIVISDESAGQEVEFGFDDIQGVIRALKYFAVKNHLADGITVAVPSVVVP